MQNKLINAPQRMSMKKWNKHKNDINKKKSKLKIKFTLSVFSSVDESLGLLY